MGQSLMLPDNVLSSEAIFGTLIGGRAMPVNKDRDFETGGVGIQDPSAGLNYQIWQAVLSDDKVILSSSNTPSFFAYSGAGLSEISFTFDRNMNFTLAFVQNGESKLYWYDSSVGGMVTTNYGPTVSSPRVSLDDKRDLQSAVSDVIFAYVKDQSLCYRQQRDRFQTEYVLKSGGVNKLKKFGMNSKLRLQFLIE